jgi:hypothetical protein
MVVSSLLGLLTLSHAAPTLLTACGAITTSGIYVVRQNLTATGDCFVIQADHVELSLAGFTLTGDGSGSGVTDGGTARTNVAVQNGTITGFANGVNMSARAGSSFQGLRLLDNTNGLAAGDSSRVSDCLVGGQSGTGVTVGAGSPVGGNIVTGGATVVSATCPTLIIGNTLTGSSDALDTSGADCLSVNGVEVDAP